MYEAKESRDRGETQRTSAYTDILAKSVLNFCVVVFKLLWIVAICDASLAQAIFEALIFPLPWDLTTRSCTIISSSENFALALSSKAKRSDS
jgi:hypothetical protein